MSYLAKIILVVFLIPLVSLYAEPLKLGVIVPLSGTASLMGTSLSGIVKLANLRNVSAEFEDDRCEAKMALSAYHKLRSSGVKVFYMACSGGILAVAPYAKRNGDLILTSYAGSARIREAGAEVLRFNPDAISVADKIARSLSEDLKPAIVMFEEQDYAQSLADRLQDSLGKSIIERLSYRANAESFASEVIRIRQRKSKSVILVPVSDGAAQRVLRAFMRDYKAQVGREPSYPFYDAIALDLLRQLDEIAATQQQSSAIRAKLLEGFSGRFATYSLSKNGEVQNGGDYLTVLRY